MMSRIDNGSPTIQRAIVQDGISAILRTLSRMSGIIREDSYSVGFQDGYIAACLAIAELIGIDLEVRSVVVIPTKGGDASRKP